MANRRKFMDAVALAAQQCTSDAQFVPLVKFLLAQQGARLVRGKAAKKPAAKPNSERVAEARAAEVRG